MPTRSQRRTAARAFDGAQAVALTDDRLHVFAHCTCGVDGLLFWIDREDDLTHYWVEWWTTQPGTRLPWQQRLQVAWRLLTRGSASTHELLLSVVGAEQLASWLLYEGSVAARGLPISTAPDLLTQRDANSNIVRGGGSGGTGTIESAHEVADDLERAGSTEAAAAVRDVARLAAGYWEDLEEFGRLKDALAYAMGLTHKCPIDVMHQAIQHFKAQS